MKRGSGLTRRGGLIGAAMAFVAVQGSSPEVFGAPAEPATAVAGAPSGQAGGGPVSEPPKAEAGGGYFYDHGGRRDPFAPIIQLEGKPRIGENVTLPPLERVNVSEINLIGIMWGGFGYTAMVQTPDGKGYTIRQGSRVGPNDGVVTLVTENTVVVREQFSDAYGNKQVRQHVKHLRQKQGAE
jgi:type IV pilus assembly protein PilP